MPKKIKKTLNYRRCMFNDQRFHPTLTNYLKKALLDLNTIESRSFPVGPKVLELRNWSEEAGNRLSFHIAGYTPGAQTTIAKRSPDAEQADVDTTDAPENHDFVEGDIHLHIYNNHLVFCGTNIHESYISKYLRKLLSVAFPDDNRAPSIALEKIAKVDMVKLIKKQGVKEVILSGALYEASMQAMEERTLIQKMLSATASSDDRLSDITEEESISARIVISKGRRDLGITQERLVAIGQNLIEEGEDDGWTIVTRHGERLKSNQILIREFRSFEPYGNTVFPDEAKSSLISFMNELDSSGVLENN